MYLPSHNGYSIPIEGEYVGAMDGERIIETADGLEEVYVGITDGPGESVGAVDDVFVAYTIAVLLANAVGSK